MFMIIHSRGKQITGNWSVAGPRSALIVSGPWYVRGFEARVLYHMPFHTYAPTNHKDSWLAAEIALCA